MKAEWLAKENGRWYLTDAGRTAFAQFKDPEAFMRAALALYRRWKKAQPTEDGDEEGEELPDVEHAATAGITLEQAQEQAWAEIEK